MSFTPDHRTPSYGRADHIDRSQETYEPSPYAARNTPPSGKVTPNGKRAYPQPGRSSQILVWGGMGIAAAALTAGTILGLRAVVSAIAGDDEDEALEAARRRAKARSRTGHPRPMPRNAYSAAPRMARDDGEHTGRHDEARREDRERIERERRRARAATSRPGVAGGFTTQVEDVTQTIRSALGTVTAAIEGFRSVSAQAGSIMNEFRGAADTVRTMFDNGEARPDTAPRQHRASDGMVDLRDTETGGTRTHRL